MTKKVLLIGGSYFIGRVFSILASRKEEYELHVVNRGRFPLKKENIKEYFFDRHDTAAMERTMPNQEYDAAIDFCAYEPGDIKSLLGHMPGIMRQYIYISSCSVFEPSMGVPKAEDAPKLAHMASGPAGEYAYHKLQLEGECGQACEEKGIAHTIVRPAFVYGPFNYAPRETYYFKLIQEGKPIPVPTDSRCAFQFVYVKDIAQALMQCIENEAVYGEDYNLSAPERVTYQSWMELLRQVTGLPLETESVTVRQVCEENIPLPFPLDQDELYDGSKITAATDFSYTALEQGMQETYESYRRSFG